MPVDIAVEQPADLTAAWLAEALHAPVADFTVERIGTGQMSDCYRVALRYDGAGAGPGTVVLKVAATDPVSRQTGLALGLYEREVRFYRDIAPRLGGPIAPCHHAAIDTTTGVFDLLLGDAGPAVVGNEIAGATAEQATLAVGELGRLHGPLLGDASLADAPWLNRDSPVSQAMIGALYAGFIERYADRITAPHRLVCERLVESFDGYLDVAAQSVQGLVHGDYRLDNMLFGTPEADRPLTVVDWQTVSWGPAMTDLAYFLGCALAPQDRRSGYDALLATYHAALGPDAPIDLAEVAEGVRRQSFFGVMMAIVSSMLVERTDRGDLMFMTMLARHCEHVLDTGALELLPAATVAEPLHPTAADELPHDATAEPLWSESWYADFADPAQGFGGWLRLGLIPNQNTAWFHALLCGPDLPTVAVVDVGLPVPADPWSVRTDAIEFGHSADAPLQTYTVKLRARGQAYHDPSALLRGEQGTPVDVTFDLCWTTDGTPYTYRLTTRYEIPCTVTGSVTVGDDRYSLDAVAGQRDHSWGVRDWWSMDWIWSALHLDDGTHLHGVNIRIPGVPAVSIGYAQTGAEFTELQAVTSTESFDDNGLPISATVGLEPAGLVVELDVRGQAPVGLISADGRVSQFPRAWVGVTAADGRTGIGWVEWNRNLPR